jgi:adenylosuccinate lyase
MDNYDRYVSPFETRYASAEMQYIFSPGNKFRTWRRLWVALARAEAAEGLDISAGQIAELEAHVDDINFAAAEARESEVRHDVMAHVWAYGQQCPAAAGIIHLGATSCYVGDNTDVLVMREGLRLVRGKLLGVIRLLAGFARRHKDMPCLAYTHLQPAQPTTVGKRAALWLSDFHTDCVEIEHRLQNLELLGSKGTTGTQASFMELFGGDEAKVKAVERRVAAEMGMEKVARATGQTYSRKQDYLVMTALSSLAQSAYKFADDLRILQSFKEMEEPFGQRQIGSSAMPYKRNPMRAERICALSRYLIANTLNPAMTAAGQWFERSLDDSANRRIAIAEGFLAADAVLNLLLNVCDGLAVYPRVVAARLAAELPFMATENILMRAVKKGGDRQRLHERLRTHSLAAARAVKEDGLPNDLLARIAADSAFGLDEAELSGLTDPAGYVGRAPQQVEDYLTEVIDPLLATAGNVRTAAEPRV